MDQPARPTGADGARAHLALVSGRADEPATAPLLPRIAAGDESAVREAVERYGGLVWSLVRRWERNPQDAEDVVQDVFIDLWRSAARFDPTRATEPGWVAMVARRRLIDLARRRQRLPELAPIDEALGVAGAQERDVDRALLAERARAALLALPEAQRRMLELSLLDGKTHDEIARETNTPLGTVKSHIRRGLKRARDLLAGVIEADAGEDR